MVPDPLGSYVSRILGPQFPDSQWRVGASLRQPTNPIHLALVPFIAGRPIETGDVSL